MNFNQQKISAKFLFLFIIAFLTNISASCAFMNEETKQSPDSDIFLDNSHKLTDDTQNILDADKLNDGNKADFNILKYNIGKINKLSVELGQDTEFDNLVINLDKCLFYNHDIFATYMAYIKIEKNNNVLFNGWIFSDLSSISLPNVDGYFFFLNQCSSQ